MHRHKLTVSANLWHHSTFCCYLTYREGSGPSTYETNGSTCSTSLFVLCWGACIKAKDANRLLKKTGCVIGATWRRRRRTECWWCETQFLCTSGALEQKCSITIPLLFHNHASPYHTSTFIYNLTNLSIQSFWLFMLIYFRYICNCVQSTCCRFIVSGCNENRISLRGLINTVELALSYPS